MVGFRNLVGTGIAPVSKKLLLKLSQITNYTQGWVDGQNYHFCLQKRSFLMIFFVDFEDLLIFFQFWLKTSAKTNHGCDHQVLLVLLTLLTPLEAVKSSGLNNLSSKNPCASKVRSCQLVVLLFLYIPIPIYFVISIPTFFARTDICFTIFMFMFEHKAM